MGGCHGTLSAHNINVTSDLRIKDRMAAVKALNIAVLDKHLWRSCPIPEWGERHNGTPQWNERHKTVAYPIKYCVCVAVCRWGGWVVMGGVDVDPVDGSVAGWVRVRV